MKQPSNYAKGEYRVGTHCFSFTDKGRKELLGNADGDRHISVRMYYSVNPADIAGKKRAVMLSGGKMKALRKSMLMPKLTAEERTADYYHVPMMNGKRFPLIVYNHGLGSYIEANTFLCCFLASRGFIVASVGHACEAVHTDYGRGVFDLMDKSVQKKMYPSGVIGAFVGQERLMKAKISREQAMADFDKYQKKYAPYFAERIDEWEKDALAAVGEIKKRYAESLDLSRGIGVTGHSLGGDLAYRLCLYHDEFTCGINIDGAIFGRYDDTAMTKPFCQMCCKENLNVMTRPLVGSKAPVWLVTFDDMKHLGFSDMIFWINMGSIVGKIPADELFAELSESHLSFFDRYLRDGSGEPSRVKSLKAHYERIDPN